MHEHHRFASAPIDLLSIGAGLAEDVQMELARNQGLNVVSRHSSFALSGKGLSTADLGKQLRVQYLVDGVVQRDGERLSLEAELIDVRADKVLWVSRLQSEGGDIVRTREEIVRRVAGSLFSTMRETEKQRAVRASPKTLDVYAWTQRGLALKHQFTPEATRDARAGLERALATDPQYGPAWWVLGFVNAVDVWMGLSGEWNHARMQEAIAQIRRGIVLARKGEPVRARAHLEVLMRSEQRAKEYCAGTWRADDARASCLQLALAVGLPE